MSDIIYHKLVEISGTLGELKGTVEGMAKRLEDTEALVKGHSDALNNGVRGEIRTIVGRLDDYVDKDREDTCFFLRWKVEQEKQMEKARTGKERRRWDARNALAIGVLLAIIGTLLGLGQWRLQYEMEKRIEAAIKAVGP